MRYIEVDEDADQIETEIRLVMTTKVPGRRGRLVADEMRGSVLWSKALLDRFPHEEDLVIHELEQTATRMIKLWKEEQSWRRNIAAVLHRFINTGKVRRRIADWFTF